MKVANHQWAAVSVILCTLLGAFCYSAEAQQQPNKVARIGFLLVTVASQQAARVEAFKLGLKELGYIEGRNIKTEYRYAEGKLDRLPSLAEELVHLKVDVIVTGGPQATRPAKKATDTIPIVMASDSDPIGNGFVASLARPGGNVTGLSALSSEISGKQLELMKEIVPNFSRVSVLENSNEPANPQSLKEIELIAKTFGVQVQRLDVRSPTDIEPAFQSATKSRADAILALASPVLNGHRKEVVTFALKSRLPAIYFRAEFVEDGGLMSYAASSTDLSRRAATYVDKILKGAKPADLPVEQPTKFELIVNLKTAKQIGLTIPPNVLARADRVIK
jgi:putative tryptophan/tyrosine transport system substrate-binding protein